MTKEERVIKIKEHIDAVYGADCAYYNVDGFAIADELDNAGYRIASDVALGVIKKMEQILTVKIIGFEEDFFHGTAAHWDGTRKECYEKMLVELAELKKKYESEGVY